MAENASAALLNTGLTAGPLPRHSYPA